MNKVHTVTDVHFEGDYFIVTIDGNCRRFSVEKISPVLKKASEKTRNNFKISHSGYGIHWPEVDEDLSIDGLLGIVHEYHCKEQVA